MKSINKSGILAGGLAVGLAILALTPTTTRANVYATNIKLNGSLNSITNSTGSSVTISYILNEPATLGATVSILSGSNTVRTIVIPSGTAGTLRGLNTVTWNGKDNSSNNVASGTYSVGVSAAASGYTIWTQTTVDASSNMVANYALGIAVDNNTNSPYYGRVVLGNAVIGSNAAIPAGAKKVGLYKMNADGSQADEGWYGNASYTNDDAGDAPIAGTMPNSGGYDPYIIRIGEDDRIYWCDNSEYGAVIACDILATTNQIVINEAGYANNPDNYLVTNPTTSSGFRIFDVSATTTTNAALWLGDNDYPSWGVQLYHMTNGTVDTNDFYGTQAVQTGYDLALLPSGGVMVDYNLDIFVGESRSGENAVYDAMVFTNWNGGILPPESSSFDYSIGYAPGQVGWGYGSGLNATSTTDPTFEAVRDVVIDSRVSPTKVAVPMAKGNNNTGGGIRMLNATNGTILTVTNSSGTILQTLTNMDWGQQYTCAAWDNVGNLYAASTTRNVWRVWSPPGANQATTVAVATVTLTSPLKVSSLGLSGTAVTVNFTGSASATAASFMLYSSANASGPYSVDNSAVITQISPGVFQATTTAIGSARFYRIFEP